MTRKNDTARRGRAARLGAGTAAVLSALALAITGCSSDDSAQGASSEFWTNPATDAAKQAATWRSQGRADDAAQLDKIARQPVGSWLSGNTAGVQDETHGLVDQAEQAGRTPVLVAYNVPNRDCGQYSSGGAADDGAYRDWIGKVAAGLGGSHAVIVLEPDALAQALTSCEGKQKPEGREALLADAVGQLTRAGGEVYIDAGNPGFVTDAGKLADGLRRAGVNQAAGFALNVANFRTTDEVEAYGKKVSDQVGGAKFVVDTSRNGRGPYPGPDQPTWCNPPGRALGTAPTRATGDPRVAAFLWVKEPGDSDGTCRGAPDAGTFWPQYALDLARTAAS